MSNCGLRDLICDQNESIISDEVLSGLRNMINTQLTAFILVLVVNLAPAPP